MALSVYRQKLLMLAGTSEGASKGWETRRGGGATDRSWTAEKGKAFVESKRETFEKNGYRAEIIGSVATKGQSDHDLDILLTPTNENYDFEAVMNDFEGDWEETWGEGGETDSIWQLRQPDGRVVDFWFADDPEHKKLSAFALYGTSEGAKLGWESRERAEPDDKEKLLRWRRASGGSKGYDEELHAVNKVFDDLIDDVGSELTVADKTSFAGKMAIRQSVKARINKDLASRVIATTGITEAEALKVTRGVVDIWADTSGDSVKEAIDLQLLANDEFAIEDAETGHFGRRAPESISEYGLKGQPDAVLRATLRAQYDATQEMFKKQGITHVTVMRGTGGSHEATEEGNLGVNLQPLSSWTTDMNTAANFAATNALGRTSEPTIMVARVPVERVFSTAATGNGCLGEKELVIFGGPLSVTSVRNPAKIPSGGAGASSTIDWNNELAKWNEAITNKALKPKPAEPKALSAYVGCAYDLSEIYNLPDISDVKGPGTLIGAIPSKPPRKRKKRVSYKGVSLSRVPTKFEAQVLSLTEIPPRLNGAVSALLAPDRDLRAVVSDLAHYGVQQVLRELVRQGAPSDLSALRLPLDVDPLLDKLNGDRVVELSSIKADIERHLTARRLRESRMNDWTQNLMARRTPALEKRYANRAVNEAFSFGRAQAVSLFRRRHEPLELAKKYRDESGEFVDIYDAIEHGDILIDAVVQTAVMDEATCDECEEVDGEVMDFASPRQLELNPPYVLCYGWHRCRCVQIAILDNGMEIDVDEIEDLDISPESD